LGLSEFGACVERITGRAAELEPAVMAAGAPSGVWLRTARADYFYYEEQTSPFHQAHIVLSLAARTLLGDSSGPAVDPLLTPDVSPRLAGLMLGNPGRRPVTRGEAEAFAFLALDRAGAASFPAFRAWCAIRRLRPLHAALVDAVPEVVAAEAGGSRRGARFRLHRQVIEIREAALALRPYRDSGVGRAAQRDGRAAGLSGDELAAAVEAAVFASAVADRKAGRRVPDPAGGMSWTRPGGPDLRSEVACLTQVSRAFSRLRRDRASARAGVSAGRPGEASLCAATSTTGCSELAA
jgi:hypothetical protein